MTHTYKITGMTCDSCQAKVQNLLQKIDGVTNVKVDWHKGEADITLSKHIATPVLQDALKAYPKYKLTEKTDDHSSVLKAEKDPGLKKHITENMQAQAPIFEEEKKSWFQTYKPVLLIFAYITGISLLIQGVKGEFNWMQWMNHFMAGFFLTFSFFKLLNLSGFADSYSTYDVIAKHWRGWGYVYAFIELGLGLAYLVGFIDPLITNAVTLVVMSISLIGVLQSVLSKRKIKCACLGDVFNLPMSTITIIEDALMILMSLIMLVYMLS